MHNPGSRLHGTHNYAQYKIRLYLLSIKAKIPWPKHDLRNAFLSRLSHAGSSLSL